MDTSLSDEQVSLRDAFRAFAAAEIAPQAQATDANRALPPQFLQRAAARGYLGATLPEAFGGAGMSLPTYVLLVEEIGRHCLSTAAALGIHSMLSGMTIAEAGTQTQKRQFLPRMATGELGTFALTEADAGSDPGSIQSRAEFSDGAYILNGVKTWVTNGGQATIHVVFAMTTPGARHHGLSAFIVDTSDEQQAAGFRIGQRESTMGMRGLDIRTVHLDGCRVPAANLLGEANHGWPLVLSAFQRVRLSLAAAGLGAAEAALDLGVQYAVARQQFGAPIATRQAIQTYVADCAVSIEALRRLVAHTAWLADSGQDYAVQASMAKYMAGRVAGATADSMQQVFGAAGFSDSNAISRIYRDVRGLRLLGGSDEIQRYSIARSLFETSGLKIQP